MIKSIIKDISIWIIAFFIFFVHISGLAASFESNKKIIIAHAGGEIDGVHYPNTLEAVLQSISKGFHYIELDLLVTVDNDLVAAHDWKTFHELTGYPDQSQPLSSDECNKRKVHKNQTVLTANKIAEVFTQNDEVYLVTDKIRDMDLLTEKFSAFLDRIIVEVEYPNECLVAKRKGIKHCAFWFNEKYDLDKKDSALITMPFTDVEKHKEWFLQHPNVSALVYTVNDENIAKKLLNYPFIKGIYSDLLPATIAKEQK